MIECKSIKSWFNELQLRYDISKTTLRETPESFTVMLHLPSKNIMAGRFCRTTGYGVVLCRRKLDMPVEYDKRGQK